MPLILPRSLPAFELLGREAFVMDEARASHQDIRPLEILIVNLMPLKIDTENQLLSLLANSPLQMRVSLLSTKSHVGKNTPPSHLKSFYLGLDQVRSRRFDGAIITGAPVERLDFSEVDYWPEFCEILDFLRARTTSSLYLCWGALASLFYFHGVGKRALKNKLFGVFKHRAKAADLILSNLNDRVSLPHSRHAGIDETTLAGAKLKILLASKKAGPTLLRDERDFFILAHPEYSRFALAREYERDRKFGVKRPKNYFSKRPSGRAAASARAGSAPGRAFATAGPQGNAGPGCATGASRSTQPAQRSGYEEAVLGFVSCGEGTASAGLGGYAAERGGAAEGYGTTVTASGAGSQAGAAEGYGAAGGEAGPDYEEAGLWGEVDFSWREAANTIFNNWLNYYVYQATPFELA